MDMALMIAGVYLRSATREVMISKRDVSVSNIIQVSESGEPSKAKVNISVAVWTCSRIISAVADHRSEK